MLFRSYAVYVCFYVFQESQVAVYTCFYVFLDPAEAQEKPNRGPERSKEPPQSPQRPKISPTLRASPEAPGRCPETPGGPTEAQQRPTGPTYAYFIEFLRPLELLKVCSLYGVLLCFRVFPETCPCVIYKCFYSVLGQAPDGPGRVRTAPDGPGKPPKCPGVPGCARIPTETFV